MTVRKANLNDIEPIANFQIKMALETEEIILDPEIVEKGVSAVLDDPSKGQYFVAVIDNKIIGSLLITYEWSDWRNGNIWWIQSVYVLPSYRRNGVFSKMYQFIQTQVQNDPEIKGIRLYAENSNKQAHKTYTNLGMETGHYMVFEQMKDF